MAIWLNRDNLTSIWPFKAKAAIFDFDGTVADSLDVWKHVDDIFFERRGMTYEPDYAEKLSILGFEEGARYTIEKYGLKDSPEEICAEWNELGRELYRTEVQLRSGVVRYIEAIRSHGIRIGLATTNRPYVLEAIEPRVQLSELFPIRVYGQELKRKTKNHPDIYLECARRLGADPGDCVVFEDIPTGLRTARMAGMTTVAVLTDPLHQDESAVTVEADYVLRNWLEFQNS